MLDQFEQWLHARRGEQDTQLVQALRHCDGGRVQSITLVRDDFWLAASRFMKDLDIRLVEADNSVLVDLFDPLHARKVLAAFGRAYGRLPDGTAELPTEQDQFLGRAVNGLAQDGKIICVRLALFAEMLKGKPWTTATLKHVGGTEGLGVAFLEETFNTAGAPAAHRHHQKAAQAVLNSLLPEAGSDIKGSRQSYKQLLETSGYTQRPDRFGELVQILDGEIRLITPTVPTGEDIEDDVPAGSPEHRDAAKRVTAEQEKYYQLTHDYLVPSLREWLTRKQKETRRGRAQLRLAERAALWNAKPENQQLPAWWEDLRIRWLTDRQKWTEPQWKMMRRAGRVHGLRAALTLSLMLALLWSGFEIYGRVQARNVLTTDAATLPTAIAQVSPWQMWGRRHLWHIAQRPPQTQDQQREQLHARLAYASLSGRYDPELYTVLYECSIPYVAVVRDVLQTHRDRLVSLLWSTLHNTIQPDNRRFRAGLALATYVPQSEQWSADDYALLAGQLVKENPIHQPLLWPSLEPLAPRLIPELEKLFAEASLPETQQIGAANALAAYCRDDGPRLARLLAAATARQYEILFPLVSNRSDGVAKAELADLVDRQPTDDLSQQQRVVFGRQRRCGH